MAAFTIRPATPADAEVLCALHKASVRALCLGAYTADEIEAWLRDREPQGFRHAMTDGGETMLVAERDGAVVGFASIKGRCSSVSTSIPRQAGAPDGCCCRRRRTRSGGAGPASCHCRRR